MRLSRKRFEALVVDAMETIPEPIRAHMDNVDITIERWPTPAQREALALDSTDALFGLYEGVPLTERGVLVEPMLPDKITIFQGPLEEAYETEAEIIAEVRKTVVHEIAHHFGINEARLAELGYD